MAVNLGAEHGHDFYQIGAKLLQVRLGWGFAQHGNANVHEPADLEDNLAAKSQQPVFMREPSMSRVEWEIKLELSLADLNS